MVLDALLEVVLNPEVRRCVRCLWCIRGLSFVGVLGMHTRVSWLASSIHEQMKRPCTA